MRKEVLLVLLVMAGCAPDPRNAADAYSIYVRTDQDAKDAEQLRLFHALDLEKQRAVMEEEVAARERLIHYGSIAGVIALVVMIGASVVVYLRILAPGLANAVVTAADIRARCIPLDRATRAYPILLTEMGSGRTALTMPGVYGVLPLDQASGPKEQMAAMLGQVQSLGLLVDAAKRSDQAGTLSMLQAPVIHAMEVQKVNEKIKVYHPRKEDAK